jgi:hypothetical protein
MEEDKRKFGRIKMDITVQLLKSVRQGNDRREEADTVDISPGGFCIRTGRSLDKDELVRVLLPCLDGADTEVLAKVVHNGPGSAPGGFFSGLAILPRYQETFSDYIENQDKGNDLTVFLNADDRAFLKSLAGGRDKFPSAIIGITGFFRQLDLKASASVKSELDLISYLKYEIRKRQEDEPES